MNKTFASYASTLLIASLLVAPAVSLAKENHQNSVGNQWRNATSRDNEDNEHGTTTKSRTEDTDEHVGGCKLGHLVAPGLLSGIATTSVGSKCPTPRGIANILTRGRHHHKGNHATTTPTTTPVDTTAPTIFVAFTQTATNSATVYWFSTELATAQIAYGTTTSYGRSSSLDSTLGYMHITVLSGLASSTIYHFKASSRDAAGNLGSSSDQTFTTSL